MKVKLKKGEQLSSNNNFCNLNYDDWASLNNGKSVELSSVPSFIEDKLESNKESKGGK
jgi:hypothetical protein|tara:strand:+ start:66 stop:239 length:174 start_codon:yes stop_codon:yes gene_type:complete